MPQPASTPVSNLVQFTRRMLEGMQTRQPAPPLDEMRSALIEQVIDCDPKQTRHVRLGVKTARSVQQLWLLRSEVYQVVSNEFGQHEAERRISDLAPMFERFVSGPRRARARG
ncbi:hypothetical protein [Ottowia sp.]|uniref:hypothetical protein n=1 Tax=Ottowia sp. TaxID=1898956 RepID=UPI001DEF14CE|nr:hypothetical protein [Ottowia sp.]MCB2034531.1 hypothetical protein [Ottowia sp.]MCP5257111.1 hypothetical protein [Burkholderiaceae bacterium]HPK33630.1 hypothetical protein [Ottowia sp.]HRW71520.1 hypothetical protein [Ottowia sp.]